MKLLLIALIAVTFITCHKSTDPYPDCFSGSSASGYFSEPCGNLTTLVNISQTRAVSIELKGSALQLMTTCTTYNITDHPGDISIKYYTYTPHPDSTYFNFCTDVFLRYYGHKTTWAAISGTITAAISKVDRQPCEDYTASMRLDNVKFISGTSDTTISLLLRDKKVNGCVP